jgi:hypothetical protein
MEEFKGTSGDWEVTNEDSGNCFIHPNRPDSAIARVYTENSHSNEAQANAQLIASAPELLKALQRLLKVTAPYIYPEMDYARRSACSVIDKALNP